MNYKKNSIWTFIRLLFINGQLPSIFENFPFVSNLLLKNASNPTLPSDSAILAFYRALVLKTLEALGL